MPLPSANLTEYVYSKTQFTSLVHGLGSSKKEYSDWYVKVFKEFGPITYGVSIPREQVCERKVVGKKIVPASPSRYIPETPEHEEDVIEWECKSILEPEEVKS